MPVATEKSRPWAVTQFFFDRAKVERMVDSRTRKALGYIGGLVRKIARRSIRTRKKPSQVGLPPSNHTGKLKDNIFYAYDPATESVVVGPTPFNMVSYVFDGGGAGRNFRAGAVPGILEKGGVVGVREMWDATKQLWKRIPWGTRLKDRYVPVWLASAADKAASVGVKTIRRGKHTINFYKVPAKNIKQKIRYATYGPRPYMAPALMKAKESYAAAWTDASGSVGRGGVQ